MRMAAVVGLVAALAMFSPGMDALMEQQLVPRRRYDGWDVEESDGQWTLVWTRNRVTEVFPIGGTDIPWGVAIDAALEFMDRTVDGTWPAFTQGGHADNMKLAVGNARRQR